MEKVILDDIPFGIEGKSLAALLKARPGSRTEASLLAMLREARILARPKAAFAVCDVKPSGENAVEVGGVQFTSRVLHGNLAGSGLAFPFAATCGTELEAWARERKSTLHSFWADSIMLMALGCAVSFLECHLKARLGEGARLSTMNPGSLEDWPLSGQAPLFSVLGSCAPAIGVSLNDRMVLRPLKSVSGIQFLSERGFVNCSLCPKERCPARRAPYEPGLYRGGMQ